MNFVIMHSGSAPMIEQSHSFTSGIYVLGVDNRPKPFFYVGKANDIGLRIQQHSDGTGAYCIAGEPFTRVDPVTKGNLLELVWSILHSDHQFRL
jgi:predicted GIY-YIG superfamily endonuclease